jgi:hypothetical protein
MISMNSKLKILAIFIGMLLPGCMKPVVDVQEENPQINVEVVQAENKDETPAKIFEKDIVVNSPGVRFHNQLISEKREEVRIVDNYTVVVGLGSDTEEISATTMEAVRSIPIVEENILPAKVWFKDRYVFLQQGRGYSWDRAGNKAVTLLVRSIRQNGNILIRVPFLQRVQILEKIQSLQESSFVPIVPPKAEEATDEKDKTSEPTPKTVTEIKPGILFHKSLPLKKKEEIKIVDDFAVEISIGSDNKWVSVNIREAVRSIPVVDENAMPQKVKMRDSFVFKQSDGGYAWDLGGENKVRLTSKDIRENGNIMISLPDLREAKNHQEKIQTKQPEPSVLPSLKVEKLPETTQKVASKPEPEAEPEAEPEPVGANIDGFRSAKFGMAEAEVLNSILKDFGVEAKSVRKSFSNTEKTWRFEILIPDLISDAGEATAVYMFGYQSKQLHQVHLFWGEPFDPEPGFSKILVAKRELEHHFSKRVFLENSVQKNVPLTKDLLLVFKGSDVKGRMVAMTLDNPNTSEDQQNKSDASLRLSLIENPVNPDVYKTKP